VYGVCVLLWAISRKSIQNTNDVHAICYLPASSFLLPPYLSIRSAVRNTLTVPSPSKALKPGRAQLHS